MNLKRYKDFINESLKNDIDDLKFWSLSEEDIREFLMEMIDENWLVTITFGFESIEKHWRTDEESREFTEKLVPGVDIKPAYWVEIEPGRNVSSNDVTDSILFTYDIMADKLGDAIELRDGDGKLDKDTLLLKGGMFIDGDIEARSYIAIFANESKYHEFSEKEVSEYYGWDCDYIDDNGNIYIEIDREDLSYELLERNNFYQDILSLNGQEHIWDNYESHYYLPDVINLFQYDLDKENSILLVKSIIKESGGWDKLSKEDLILNIDKEFTSESEFIDYAINERFYETLKEMCDESEIAFDIRQTIADWEMNSHADTNYEEILSEFDRKVDEEFNYTIIKKEVELKYKTKDTDGNDIFKKYNSVIDYYRIEFDSSWIEEMDSDDLYNISLIDIFKEYCASQYYSMSMNPRLSDYGNVDSKELNIELGAILKNYLK